MQDNKTIVYLKKFSCAFFLFALSFFIVNINFVRYTERISIFFSFVFLCITYCSSFRLLIQVLKERATISLILFLLFVCFFSMNKYGLLTTLGAVTSKMLLLIGFFAMYAFIKIIRPSSMDKELLAGIFGIWLLESFWLIYLSIQYHAPHLSFARAVISGNENSSLAAVIGNPYGIAQSACFLAVVLFDVLLNIKNKLDAFHKVITMIAFVVFFLCVAYSKSLITFAVLGIGMGEVVLKRLLKEKKIKHIIFIGGILSLGFFLRAEIGEALISYFEAGHGIYGERIMQIGNLMLGRTGANEIQSIHIRADLFVQSWNSIWNYPFTGNLYNAGRATGEHCEFLDILSDYGFIGGGLFFLIFIYAIKFYYKEIKLYNSVAYVPVIIMSFLNPMRIYQTCFTILFLVPVCYYYFSSFYYERDRGQGDFLCNSDI